MQFPKKILLATAFLGAALARPALADLCHEPLVFLVGVVVVPYGETPGPQPFDNVGKSTVTLKTTSCENPFTTVASQEVTFTWALRPKAAKDLTFSIVGPHTVAVTSGKPIKLPAGEWAFRIERPGLKDRRLDVLTFELTSRFKGEIMP